MMWQHDPIPKQACLGVMWATPDSLHLHTPWCLASPLLGRYLVIHTVILSVITNPAMVMTAVTMTQSAVILMLLQVGSGAALGFTQRLESTKAKIDFYRWTTSLFNCWKKWFEKKNYDDDGWFSDTEDDDDKLSNSENNKDSHDDINDSEYNDDLSDEEDSDNIIMLMRIQY